MSHVSFMTIFMCNFPHSMVIFKIFQKILENTGCRIQNQNSTNIAIYTSTKRLQYKISGKRIIKKRIFKISYHNVLMGQYTIKFACICTNEKFAPMNNKKCDDELATRNADVAEVDGNNNLYGQL